MTIQFLGKNAWAKDKPPELATRIAQLVQDYQAPQVQMSLWIGEVGKTHPLYERNSHLPLNPASNQKILTTWIALQRLGPQFQFKTILFGQAGASPNGLSSLTLKGFGDPTLRTADLWQIIGELKAQGIQQVNQIYVDDTYLDRAPFPGRLGAHQIDSPYNATVSGIPLDQNLLTVLVEPGEKVGQPARVNLVPPLSSLEIKNEVTTKGKKPRIIVKNRRASTEDDGLWVTGSIPAAYEPQTFLIAQAQPMSYLTKRLRQGLLSFGVTVPDSVVIRPVPEGSQILAQRTSPPLGLILQEINKYSNNFITEQLTKVLGAKILGPPGTTAKGVSVIHQELLKEGNASTTLQLENGSGLSKNNRLTASTLAMVLTQAYQTLPLRPEFVSSLSVLGVDGTLKDKFFDKGLEGYFRGKTGTLRGVTSLSGYVFSKKNPQAPPLILSYLANGEGKDFGKQIQFQQKLLELLIER